jgi:hypothetical protein
MNTKIETIRVGVDNFELLKKAHDNNENFQIEIFEGIDYADPDDQPSISLWIGTDDCTFMVGIDPYDAIYFAKSMVAMCKTMIKKYKFIKNKNGHGK